MKRRVIELYYLATPVFFLVDVLWHEPVRVSALGGLSGRFAYYLILVGLGFLCRARPGWAPVVGMSESAVNLLMLILSIMMPIWGMTDQVMAGGNLDVGLTPARLVNFALAGGMAIISFKRSEHALYRRAGRSS